MFKYFGLIHKLGSAINYTVVCGSSNDDVLQMAIKQDIRACDIIDLKEMPIPTWAIVEPVMCAATQHSGLTLRNQFFNNGNIMAEYYGLEYGFRPKLYPEPLAVGKDEEGEIIYEIGKAEMIDLTRQSIIKEISLDALDESHLMDKLTYEVMAYYLEYVDAIDEIRLPHVTLH